MIRVSSANRVVAGAIAMAAIAGCGLSLSITLLSVRLDAAGYSAHAIGLNTAAGAVSTLIGAPFIPWAAKRLGVARLLLASLSLGGVAMVGFTLSSDYSVWLALRFGIGFCVTILFALSEFWIGTAATHGRRGLAIGLYATSLAIGFAIGPVLLAVTGTVGDQPFFLGAGLFWMAVIPLVLIMRGAPPLEDRSRKPFWVFLIEAPTATLAGLLQGAVEVASISLLPVYALQAGASVEQGTIFASLFLIGNSAFQVPLGLLSDRVDRLKLLVALAFIGLTGALFLATVGLSSLILFEVVLLLWGGMVGGLYPVGLAHLGAHYRDGELAGANSAFVMTYSFGMMVGPPAMGVGLDLIPPSGFFLSIALFIGLYLLLSIRHLVKTKPEAVARETRETQSFS